MSTGLNFCIAIGNLRQDAELRETQTKSPVTSFDIACGERFRDAEKNWRERVEWISCVLYGKRAQGLNKYLQKGMKVAVVGSLRTRTYWSKKDKCEKKATEVRCSDIIPLTSPEGRQLKSEPQAMAEVIAKGFVSTEQ